MQRKSDIKADQGAGLSGESWLWQQRSVVLGYAGRGETRRRGNPVGCH